MIAIRLPDDQLTPKKLAQRLKNRKYYQKYMANNLEKVRRRNREKYHAHPDRYAVYNKKWHERNPDYVKNYCREKYLNGTHHDSNANRTPEMIRAHNLSKDIPMTKFCELCPPDDLHLSQMRHHPDYNYPTIFVSTCRACHTAVHRALEKEEEPTKVKTLLNFMEVTV